MKLRLVWILPLAIAVHAVFFWGAHGFIDKEGVVFVSNYLAERPWLAAIFDPHANDFGTFQARELSYAFDYLNALLEHERFAGRVRRTRWGPRELDLDLLWMDDVILDEPGLTLPHPRIPERPFVLEPLAEIAPEWRHPQTSMSAREMLDALHARGDSTRSAGKHT